MRCSARLAAGLLAASFAVTALAQPPDLVLLDGKIVTVDAGSSLREALAIRDGKILRVGSTAEIRRLAGLKTRVVALRGRTVIPGLIDSHLHAVRAALSFSTEVNWIGARSLREALGRISAAAARRPPGSWLIVAGGWNELQFAERRRPTMDLPSSESVARWICRPAARSRATASGSRAPSAVGKARSSRCSIGCRSRRSPSKCRGRASSSAS